MTTADDVEAVTDEALRERMYRLICEEYGEHSVKRELVDIQDRVLPLRALVLAERRIGDTEEGARVLHARLQDRVASLESELAAEREAHADASKHEGELRILLAREEGKADDLTIRATTAEAALVAAERKLAEYHRLTRVTFERHNGTAGAIGAVLLEVFPEAFGSKP